ncbi:ABC transporter permease/M1 family aminopeptidase [Glaciecola sp. 1036]|uniref:ABC transporter permease/M1 family aminopeptidase n=1 Tax=Alteromonadaceae TaxID=72275 RepID=UPI003CFD4D12
MLWRMFKFEWRYYLHQPSFVVTSLIFFLLPFLSITLDQVHIGATTNLNANSPYAINQALLIFSVFGMFLVVNFIGSTALREKVSGMNEIIYTKPIDHFRYHFGRFLGGYAMVLTVFAMVPLGLMLGSLMPWLVSDKLGPFNIWHYIQPFLVFTVPSMLLFSCLFYAAARLFKSILAVYLSALGLLILYIISEVMFTGQETRFFMALIDPFGINAYLDVTRYWTPSMRNSQIIGFETEIVLNRIIWLAIAILSMLTLIDFRKPLKLSASSPNKIPSLSGPPQVAELYNIGAKYQEYSAIEQFKVRTEFEIRQIIKSPSFIVLLGFCTFMMLVSLLFEPGPYGSSKMPLTQFMVELIQSSYGLLMLIIITFYTAETVWRERLLNMSEVIEAMPVENPIFWLSKLISVIVIQLIIFAFGVSITIYNQLIHTYFDLDISQYFISLVYFYGLPYVYLTILSFFIQVLSPNKYIGMLIFVSYIFVSLVFAEIGIEHNMFNFASAPVLEFSDMNRYGWYMQTQNAYMLYWGALSLILSAFSFALWRRGYYTTLSERFRYAGNRLGSSGRALALFATVAFVISGTLIHYNTKVTNQFISSDRLKELKALYETQYSAMEDLVVPQVSEVDLNVAIFPQSRKLETVAKLTLVNDSPVNIERFLVNLPAHSYDIKFTTEQGRVVMDEQALNTAWFTFDMPLAPGATLDLTISLARQHFGFKDKDEDASLVTNGTFIDNRSLLPTFGVKQSFYLTDNFERAEFGLMPRDDTPDEPQQNILGDSINAIKFKARLSTHESQIAIAPGYLKKYWTENGRNHFIYEMDKPMMNFYSILSADLKVKSTMHNGVEIAVYYHPKHEWNVATMIEATQDALDAFSQAFGKYQYRQMRIIEFPSYREFAQSFPNTVPYSESLGFVADLRDETEINYAYYLTAHEIAHQWFGHQLMVANVAGGDILVESLSQYAALNLMRQKYGALMLRKVLKHELNSYLSGRTLENRLEPPLSESFNRAYIHYNKGGILLMAIAERIGIQGFNGALKQLIEEYNLTSGKFATIEDFISLLKKQSTNEDLDFIDDAFNKIAIHDFSLKSAVLSEKDGIYKTTLEISVAKFYASGNGDETEVAFNDEVSIGLYTNNPDEITPNQSQLHLQEYQLTSGLNEIVIETNQKPSYAVADPLIQFIDREIRDNTHFID